MKYQSQIMPGTGAGEYNKPVFVKLVVRETNE
jgi:hypothetical protein